MTPGTVAIILVGSFTLIMAIFLGLVTWANWDIITDKPTKEIIPTKK